MPTTETVETTTETVETPTAMDEPQYLPDMYAWLDSLREVAIDTETSGLDPYGARQDRICGVSLYADGFGCYLPFRHTSGSYSIFNHANNRNLPESELGKFVAYLNNRLRNGSLDLITWNGKFDLHMFHVEGLVLPVTGVRDAMLSAHLLNENEITYALKPLSDKYLGDTSSRDESELRVLVENAFGHQKAGEWKGLMHRLPADDVAPYAISDTRLTWDMQKLHDPALEAWGLADLYRDLCDYELLITRMEAHGIKLDVAEIQRHMATSGPEFEKVKGIIREDAFRIIESMPKPQVDKPKSKMSITEKVITDPEKYFNPGSPAQIKWVYGWEAGDKEYLEKFAEGSPDYERAQTVLDYRVLSKMNGTYYDAYLDLMSPDHILRPNYNLIGTVNGRLSCNRPNIQNVPRYSERRRVKDVFIPSDPEHYSLLEIDYRAAELRLATHFSNEKTMREIINKGRDPHGETATAMGVGRHIGKTLNFAVIYGAGAKGLCKLLKCDEQTARDYLSGYFQLYPGFKRFSIAAKELADEHGFIRMPTGRIRHFKDPMTGAPAREKGQYYPIETRKAMNSWIQGASSEMLRVAMQRIDDRIRREKIDAHLLFQVHDSVMLNVRDTEIPRLFPILREEMTNFDFNPRPDIEAKVGKRWGQMKEVAI